jgi:DNA-binding LytR/AlgR family response regulator
MIKIVIIEDESLAVDRLTELLKEHAPDFEILKVLDGVQVALDYFKENEAPDLVFMDIELTDGTSFDLLKRYEMPCPVIFVTAYDQFALKAFEVLALDYILKPVKAENLQRAIARFRKTHPEETEDSNMLADAGRSRFVIRQGQKLHVVEYADIAYIFSEEKSTFLVSKDKHKFALDQSLDHLENELSKLNFFRLNRKFLVCHSSIDSIRTLPKSKLLVQLIPEIDIEAIVSSEKSALFKKWLAGK